MDKIYYIEGKKYFGDGDYIWEVLACSKNKNLIASIDLSDYLPEYVAFSHIMEGSSQKDIDNWLEHNGLHADDGEEYGSGGKN